MKIAAIYDIHGNTVALSTVLKEIRKADVDLVVVGGDVVAGPLPNETIHILKTMGLPTKFILGNAESDVLRNLAGETIGGLTERANEEARWVSSVLTPDNVDFVSTWKPSISLDTKEWGEMYFCHSTPRSNAEIFTKLTPIESLLPIFNPLSASLVICGHTHMQFDIFIGRTRVINAGSVGMPFGHTSANWLLIDDEIHFQYTKYNLEDAAELVRNSHYPHANEFVENYIFHPPSEAKMLESLQKMALNNF